MSKIKLPHASGNSMSIAAPATNPASDLELKLPNSVGTGKINHSNFLEQISSPCDGSSITVPSGTYTVEDKDDNQTLTNTFTDIAGSSISYTPPAGATQVIYEYLFSGIYEASPDTNPIIHVQFFIDSDEVTDARMTYAGQYAQDLFSFKWTINIGGSAVTATGRQATWTSAKTLKCRARDMPTGNDAELNHLRWWDGSTGDFFHRPQISITALGVPT